MGPLPSAAPKACGKACDSKDGDSTVNFTCDEKVSFAPGSEKATYSLGAIIMASKCPLGGGAGGLGLNEPGHPQRERTAESPWQTALSPQGTRFSLRASFSVCGMMGSRLPGTADPLGDRQSPSTGNPVPQVGWVGPDVGRAGGGHPPRPNRTQGPRGKR